jgi:hypothetical protein
MTFQLVSCGTAFLHELTVFLTLFWNFVLGSLGRGDILLFWSKDMTLPPYSVWYIMNRALLLSACVTMAWWNFGLCCICLIRRFSWCWRVCLAETICCCCLYSFSVSCAMRWRMYSCCWSGRRLTAVSASHATSHIQLVGLWWRLYLGTLFKNESSASVNWILVLLTTLGWNCSFFFFFCRRGAQFV